MFRIRRVIDQTLPVDLHAVQQAEEIFRSQFHYVPAEDIRSIGDKLGNPFRERLRYVLYVAESARGVLLGASLVCHDPDLKFCFLDFLAAARGSVRGGVGGALYERVRHQAAAWGCRGLFADVLTDDPEKCPEGDAGLTNASRLKFYERYGARPIVNTRYDTQLAAWGPAPFLLLFDALDSDASLSREWTRKVVAAVLTRKYGDTCSAALVEEIVSSFQDDPVRIRPFRYVRPEKVRSEVVSPQVELAALVATDRHAIHHVRERGYVEAPVRVDSILKVLEGTGRFERVRPRSFPEKHILAVHDKAFILSVRSNCV